MPTERNKRAHSARQEAAEALQAYNGGERDAERIRRALAGLFLTNVHRPIVNRWARERHGFGGSFLCWRDLVGRDLCPCPACSEPGTFDAAIDPEPVKRPRVYLVPSSAVRAASEGQPLRVAVGGYLTRYALAYAEQEAAKLRAEGYAARVFMLTGEGAQDPDEPATARAWDTYNAIKADGRAEDWHADVTEATKGAEVELHAGRGWHRLAGRPEHWKRPVTGRPETRAA